MLEENQVIRRILVALDASESSMAALKAAVDLAARMKAELQGLFVEDIDLFHLAELPFSRAISTRRAGEIRLDSREMERMLKIQADKVKKALKTMAHQVRVSWSFRTIRGEVTSTILSAAADADLLALGKIGRPLRRIYLGSTAQAAVKKSPRSVLLLPRNKSIRNPVFIIHEDCFAQPNNLLPTVLLLTQEGDSVDFVIQTNQPQTLEHQVCQWLHENKRKASCHLLDWPNGKTLQKLLCRENCGPLVLYGTNSLLQDEQFQKMLQEVDCPLLLMR